MTTLETERLLIRNFCSSDADALVEIITRYASSELAAYDQPWPTSPEEIQQITDWFASGDSYLAVCLKATGCLIGFVALNPEEQAEQHTFNLGYVFHFDYRVLVQPCPENNRRGAQNAEKAREDLCALCAFAVAFIGCGALSAMFVFREGENHRIHSALGGYDATTNHFTTTHYHCAASGAPILS